MSCDLIPSKKLQVLLEQKKLIDMQLSIIDEGPVELWPVHRLNWVNQRADVMNQIRQAELDHSAWVYG